MVDFISGLIGNDYLATAVMSVIPLIELKGGIVFARGTGLDFFLSFALAYLGSTLAFFLVFFLLKPILNLLKRIKAFKGFADSVEAYFKGKAVDAVKKKQNETADETASAKTERRIKFWAVFVFVAIPLPMTGVWTGTAISVFLDMNFKDALIAVAGGNAVAGLIISLLAQLCLTIGNIRVLDYVLYALFIIALVLLAVTIIKIASSKKRKKDAEDKKE